MKKFICMIICIAMTVLSGCGLMADRRIPAGYLRAEEHKDPAGFQDYTDYCVYQYDTISCIDADSHYRFVTDADIQKITGYFSNFQQWMETEKRLNEYTFDESCITVGDYFYIQTKEGQPIGSGRYGVYDNYSVYFFDKETMTLYYIHNNI